MIGNRPMRFLPVTNPDVLQVLSDMLVFRNDVGSSLT